jgi:SAM-dependent methyltransferase
MAEPYSHPGSAQVYDAVYAEHHPYAGGAAKVLEVVRQAGDGRDPTSMSLLDVGCGTGRHLELLAGEFGSVAGVDLSEVQLAAAAERLGPGIPLYHGDMLALGSVVGDRPRAGQAPTFDVILCLHSSIAYLASAGELTTAIGEMARLLAPGGMLIIEPWLRPDTYRSFGVITYFIDRPDLKVARMCVSDREGDVSVLDMHHLVGRPEGIEHYVEAHRLRMFSEAEFDRAFRVAGVEARFDPDGIDTVGRGLWVARKPG